MSARLHIGYFIYPPRLGGAESYLRDLLWGVDRERFEVSLVAPVWPEFDRFLGLKEAPPVTRIPVAVREPGTRLRSDGRSRDLAGGPPSFGLEAHHSRFRSLAALPALSRLVPAGQWALRQLYWVPDRRRLAKAWAAARFDIVHVINGGYPGATSARAAIAAAADCGIPGRILTVCSTALPRIVVPAVDRRIDRDVDASAKIVIVPARRPRDALVDLRGFSADKLRIVPWGVEAPPPAPEREPAQADARRALGLPPTGPVIGTLGNFTPTKGHVVVLEAIGLLRPRHPSLTAVLSGTGPQRCGVEARCGALGLSDVVRFPGAVPDVFTFLRALDVFVLASDIEGLPLVVLEAMSQGVPVVATDVGGMPDAVLPGRTGYLVPVRDPAAIADAVDRILSDRSRAAEMGKTGRLQFEEHFSLEVMLKRHQELYEQSVQDRPDVAAPATAMTNLDPAGPLSGARCLVTGASGFLGTHLVLQLVDAGAEVVAASRTEQGGPTMLAGVAYAHADMTNANATKRMVRQAEPTHVFHLAGVRGTSVEWAELEAGNVLATINLLDSLRAGGLRPWIVIAGSSAVYGLGTGSPFAEQASLQPVSLYGVAKAAQELVAVREKAAFGAPIVIARLFNLVGPGQDPSLLLASVARQVAMAERDPSGVVRVGNLDSRRDFVDVRDAARALVRLAGAGAGSGAYNVASGIARPVREAVLELIALGARPIALHEAERGPTASDVAYQLGDSTRLRDEVDWHPTRAFGTSLQDMLDDWRRRTATTEDL